MIVPSFEVGLLNVPVKDQFGSTIEKATRISLLSNLLLNAQYPEENT